MKIVDKIEEFSENEIMMCGNKAKNLWIMNKNNINIPETISVICAKYWNEVDAEYVLHKVESFVNDNWEKDEEIIIRSSFYNEDSMESSMAGIFKSIHICSREKIKEAICDVWNSANTQWEDMGIVIQKYKEAQYSGILFSNSPHGKDNNIIIEFAPTACSRLVKGDISPDLYVNDFGWFGNTPDYVEEKILHELIEKEQVIKKILECDIDIEFCVSNGQLYFLQCRPITMIKKIRPKYSGEKIAGNWILQEELSLPFTPLIRTMDPSGILTERPHVIFENYAYFSSEFRLKMTDNEKWKNWNDISRYYMDELHKIESQSQFADFELLENAIKIYRNVVEAYMNLNWFIYRKKCYDDLMEDLQKKYDNYHDIFWGVMQSIETINVKKRHDFVNLVKAKGKRSFLEEKDTFIRKYGAETSHPFYIISKSLADYLDIVIDAADESNINLFTNCERFESICEKLKMDGATKELVKRYREVTQRTEDDDYLLCFGAYVIKKILHEIENKLALNEQDIYYYEYEELQGLLNGNRDSVSAEIIEKRRKEFLLCQRYDMPLALVNGDCVYNIVNSNSILEGVTVSPGYTKGKVYVLNNPGDIFEIINIPKGSIVYSKWISPVLSSYFFNIKGLILPEKSILSHGAILAREMGIPAIGGILYDFHSEDKIELNATEGKIYLRE